MSINLENISLLVSGCMDLLGNKLYSSCMDLFRLPFCAHVAWIYMITILCSGCTDLQDCHFVLRPHGPIWLPFCAQVAWKYIISVMICILYSGHMDLPQRDLGFAILHSDHMDLYNCHFALRSHKPILYILHLNITMLPSAIPTYHSSPQCTHVPFYKLWHYNINIRYQWI